MIVHDKRGRRVVELYLPFEYMGRPITSIAIGPYKLDHTLRWNAGKFPTALALLTDLCDLEEPVLRELVYPDASRVMTEFFAILPDGIREMVMNGRIPQQEEPLSEAEAATAALLTNGGDVAGESQLNFTRPTTSQPPPPAAALPIADPIGLGFDLGEH